VAVERDRRAGEDALHVEPPRLCVVAERRSLGQAVAPEVDRDALRGAREQLVAAPVLLDREGADERRVALREAGAEVVEDARVEADPEELAGNAPLPQPLDVARDRREAEVERL